MNDIQNMYFSINGGNEATMAIEAGVALTMDAMDKSKSNTNEYAKENHDVKRAILNFCADSCSMQHPAEKKDLIRLFSNTTFESMFNSIIAEIQSVVMVRAQSPQIMAMANVVNVDAGDSYTWEIDTKGLPVVQRASYTSNLSLLDGYAMQGITITPIPYTVGTHIDYIRMLANDYDFGREMARVYQAFMYHQTTLIANSIFSATATPAALYKATWNSNDYVKMSEVISAYNNANGVTAYGTRTAWNAIGALATAGGFTTRDQYIENGFLQKVYGVDSVLVENTASLSAPIAATLANVALGVPTNMIVMLSNVGDKPVKLVRENYVRVQRDDQNAGSLNRIAYKYFMSYDVGIATGAHFAVQNTTAA